MRLSRWLLCGVLALCTSRPFAAQTSFVSDALIHDFRQWAPSHLHPVATDSGSFHADGDLAFLKGVIGAAQVISLGEPIHNDHEVLEFRNRLVRYGVVKLGLRSVAFETCLSSSKVLYDYVLGRSDVSDVALKEAFCYGFGNYPEDLAMIHWLKTYNKTQPDAGKVHFYGIDLSGQFSPTAYKSLDAALAFLDKADPTLGGEIRRKLRDVLPVFRIDRYIKLTATQKDACTASIQDLISTMRRERSMLTEKSSRDDYEWALRQAIVASQDDAFLRSIPSEFDPNVSDWWKAYQPDTRWDHNAEMREVAMADNVLWVRDREREHGKVLYFAHDEHVETGLGMLGSPDHPPPGQYQKIRSAGRYLRSALGSDLLVVGTYLGHGEGYGFSDNPAPAVHSMEDLLGSVGIPSYLINLHELPASGPLQMWFVTPHATRSTILRDATDSVAPLASYDFIFFIKSATPSFLPHK